MRSLRRLYAVILLGILLFTAMSAATPWRVSGEVADASGDPLPGVVVKLIDAAGNTVAYSTTEGKGHFTLSHSTIPGKEWKISFNFLGFSTKTITPAELKAGMKIILEEAPFELKEVIVKIPPIKSRGDTLTYDVASFRGKGDRNIEDVIKKLPGIEVNESGAISYNGETINRFYIEGLDVVSGRYAIATRNISPDDILSVDIYENHQPKKVLKDIDFSNKAALNLTMKRKRMLKPIGNIKGGAGRDGDDHTKWLGEGFGMLIAPATQTIITTKANNWGNTYEKENRSFTGEEDKTTVASTLYGSTPFGTAKIPTERYFDNRSATASVNTIRKIGENSKLNITADYTDELNRSVNTESITYTNGDNPAIGFYESVTSHPHSREAKFSAKIEHNSTRNFLSDQLSFRGHFADNGYSIINSGDIRQTSRTDNYDFKNILDGTVRIGNRIISIYSNISVVTTPVSRLSATDSESPLLAQSGGALTFTTSEKAGCSWMIGSTSTLGVNLRFESEYDTFKSHLTTSSASGATNNVRGHELQAVLEPEYRYKPTPHFYMKVLVPITVTSLKFRDILTQKLYPADKSDIGLRASFNFKPSAKFSGSFTLGHSTSLGGIHDYITVPVYVTYRQRTTFGSGQLNERETSSIASSLSFRDPIKAFFINLGGFYRISNNNRISGSNVTSDEVSTLVENGRNRSDMLNLTLSLSKNIRPWRTTITLHGGVNSISRKILRQQNPYKVDNRLYTLRGAVSSTPFNGAVDLTASISYNSSDQRITALGLHNDLHNLVAQGSLSVHPLSKVELYTQVFWNQVSVGQDGTKESLFLGAGIRYHAGHFDVEFSGKNLTNSRNYSYSYFSDSDLYSYSFTLRPIEFMASVKYSF